MEYIKEYLEFISCDFINFWETELYFDELFKDYNVYTIADPKSVDLKIYTNCYRLEFVSNIGNVVLGRVLEFDEFDLCIRL